MSQDIQVIDVTIDPDIFEVIRKAIESCDYNNAECDGEPVDGGVALDNAPIFILVPLLDNRVVQVWPRGREFKKISELPEVQPLSLVPAAFFVGRYNPTTSCSAVGDKNRCILW